MDTEVFRVVLQHHSLHMPGAENATEAERAPKWDEFSFTVLTSYCRGVRCQTRLIALPHSEILAMWKGRGLRFVLNFAWYNAAEWREEEMLQTSWFHPVTRLMQMSLQMQLLVLKKHLISPLKIPGHRFIFVLHKRKICISCFISYPRLIRLIYTDTLSFLIPLLSYLWSCCRPLIKNGE